ncbi:hypothetical protein ABZ703_42850, partial [Streptomyces massasporeus]
VMRSSRGNWSILKSPVCSTIPAPVRIAAALVRAVRGAVSARHGLRLADVVVVPPGTVPRTSSGKVSRALTRARYLEGAYGGQARTGAAV